MHLLVGPAGSESALACQWPCSAWEASYALAWTLKATPSVQAYVSYRVRTRTTAPQYGGRAPEVIRRFSDFAMLHEQLHRKFKGGDVSSTVKFLALCFQMP